MTRAANIYFSLSCKQLEKKKDADWECALQRAAGIYWGAMIYESFSVPISTTCLKYNTEETLSKEHHRVEFLTSEVWLLMKKLYNSKQLFTQPQL